MEKQHSRKTTDSFWSRWYHKQMANSKSRSGRVKSRLGLSCARKQVGAQRLMEVCQKDPRASL